jgi:hypothetical protein
MVPPDSIHRSEVVYMLDVHSLSVLHILLKSITQPRAPQQETD